MSARERVAEFLRQWDLRKGNDRNDTIYGVFNDPDAAMAELLASDVETLLQPQTYWTAGDLSRELGLTIGGANYWARKFEPAGRTRQGMGLYTDAQAQQIIDAYTENRKRAIANKQARNKAITAERERKMSQTTQVSFDLERADRALQYLLSKDTA